MFTEDDTYHRLIRASFDELKGIMAEKKPKDLDSLLLILQRSNWTTSEWKEALEEESAAKRPPLKPGRPKSFGPLGSPIPVYNHRKDSQFSPAIKDISDYMRNLVIEK